MKELSNKNKTSTFRRPSLLYDELKAVMTKMIKNKPVVLLWQKGATPKERPHWECLLGHFSRPLNTLEWQLLDVKNPFSFNRSKPLYFHCLTYKLFGKLKFCNEQLVKDKVKTFYPSSLSCFIDEKRQGKRLLTFDRKITLALQWNSQRWHCLVIDISPQGAGLLLTLMQKNLVKTKDKVTVREINGIKLPRSLQGKIKHISNQKKILHHGRNHYSVGVSFNDPLDQELFCRIMEKILGPA